MQWKITTGSDRANANAQNFTGTEGRPVFVDVVHPGVGPDARVRIIDVTTQRTVADLSCGFTDQGPKRAEFSPVASGSRSYNLIVEPVGATFGDPGISITANATSPEIEVPYTVDPATNTTQFGGAVGSANIAIVGTAKTPYDVVILGATPGGMFAGIAAKLAGARSVVVLEATDWVGGMLSGGISSADIQPASSTLLIQGMANDFYAELGSIYGVSHTEFFRSQLYHSDLYAVAGLLNVWAQRVGLEIRTNEELVSIEKAGTKIVSVTTAISGRVYGRQFIDGSYPADSLALAGVTHTLGREAQATYSETYAGIRAEALVPFPGTVDPYVIPGDAESGLLPGMLVGAFGTLGAADPNIQAFGYRFAASTNPDRVAFPEPDNYDPMQYELLGRAAVNDAANLTSAASLMLISGTGSNGKSDINSKYCMSTDYIAPHSTDPTKTICTEYITATLERRREIEYEVKQYTLGLIKFIKTDSRIPVAVRTDMARYGLAADEFGDYGNFPPGGALYVREGRRLVGDFVLKQADVTAVNAYGDPIAQSYYSIDSHTVRRVVVAGAATNEGGVSNTGFQGSNIPMRVLFPKKTECTNLQVIFGASVSRIAFCSIRMEPIQMAMGEAAGIIAALAARKGGTLAVQDVPFSQVRARMRRYRFLNRGAKVISVDGTTYTQGIVETNGTWAHAANPANGCILVHATCAVNGGYKRFRPILPQTGTYRVRATFPVSTGSTRNQKTPVSVVHGNGTTSLTLNQDWTNGGVAGDWEDLGTYQLQAGFRAVKFGFPTLPNSGNTLSFVINGTAVGPVAWAGSVALTFAAACTAIMAAVADTVATYDATNINIYSYSLDIVTATCTVAGGTNPSTYWSTAPSPHYVEFGVSLSASTVIAGVAFELVQGDNIAWLSP